MDYKYIRANENFLDSCPFSFNDYRPSPKDKLESLKLELKSLQGKKEGIKEQEKELKRRIRILVKELQKE